MNELDTMRESLDLKNENYIVTLLPPASSVRLRDIFVQIVDRWVMSAPDLRSQAEVVVSDTGQVLCFKRSNIFDLVSTGFIYVQWKQVTQMFSELYRIYSYEAILIIDLRKRLDTDDN